MDAKTLVSLVLTSGVNLHDFILELSQEMDYIAAEDLERDEWFNSFVDDLTMAADNLQYSNSKYGKAVI